jgi:hypothetical protein
MIKLIFTVLALFGLIGHAQVPARNLQSTQTLVPNGGFENGRAKWTTFSTTVANGIPTTAPATCAACSITIGAYTSAPLDGTTSLQITAASGVTAGHGLISNPFTLPAGYGGASLSLGALFKLISGTPVLVGNSSNTWAMAVFDQTNQVWLPTTNFNLRTPMGFIPNSTVVLGQTTAQVRVAFFAANTLATATTAILDDVNLSIGQAGVLSYTDALPANILTFTSSGTYSPTPGTRYIRVKMCGGGGGGSGSFSSGSAGGGIVGTLSSFGTQLVAGPGAGGAALLAGSQGGQGGSAACGTVALCNPITGNAGQGPQGSGVANQAGPNGGTSPLFGGGASGIAASNGQVPTANSGAGGAGASNSTTAYSSGSSGGSGGCIDAIIINPSVTPFVIGTGGAGGTAGTNGFPGGNGAAGKILIEEYAMASGQAFVPATAAWRIDTTLTNSSAWSYGTAAITTPSENLSTGTITKAQVGNSASVGIACPSGVQSVVGATSCTGGSVSNGITFNAPYAGDFEVCAEMSAAFDVGASSDVNQYFSIAETGNSNATPVATNTSLTWIHRASNYNNTNSQNDSQKWTICQGMNFPSATQRTVKLFETQSINAGSFVSSTAGGALRWTVKPSSQQSPSPVIIGPFNQMPSNTITVASYTALPTDQILDIDTTAQAITITLPTAVGVRGKTLTLTKVNTGSNLVTVNTTSSQTIGTSRTSFKMHRVGESVSVFSDGTNWQWVGDSGYRTESVLLTAGCTASPCVISKPNGNWVSSVTRSGVGDYIYNFVAGIFSDVPTCSISAATGGQFAWSRLFNNATTGVEQVHSNSSQNLDSSNMNLVCTGPR